MSVASLGWVTPGAASEGVTPVFFPEKPGDLFLLIAVTITIAFYCFHSGVTPPPRGCHPTPFFYLSDLVSPIFFLNLPTNFFSFGCHPLEGVTRGGPPSPHLVTPLNHVAECYGGNKFKQPRMEMTFNSNEVRY